MSKPVRIFQPSPFNTPIESGLGSLIILTEAFPVQYDLQRLLLFDYLLVHSADADGPESLHPGTPHRSGEILVRRGVVEEGLLFLLNRGLIERNFSSEGITYNANEESAPFLEYLEAKYTGQLKERAKWLIDSFGDFSDKELAEYFKTHLDRWGSEFGHESYFRELPQ